MDFALTDEQAALRRKTVDFAGAASALTELHLGESFVSSSIDSIRNHGATGYLTEFGIEGDARDAMGGIIYGGTSDIQRRAIARLLRL